MGAGREIGEGLFSLLDIFVAPQAAATFSGKLSDGVVVGGAGQHHLAEGRKQEV